jgi:dipeptidyl aminopeptidase/acylaminoacyl peptidase
LEQVTGDYDVEGFRLSPRGDAILVWANRPVGAHTLADVRPPPATSRGSARIYDQLPVRFWNEWSDGQRSQLFVMSLAGGHAEGSGHAIEGALVGDVPSKPSGGREELAWSPDGRTIYFSLREAGRIEPMSTNFDIFSAPADGSAPPTNLTGENKAIDTQPAVSPDGRWLAWLATTRPGYENDREVLMVRELVNGQTRALTGQWDRTVDALKWLPDSSALYVTAQDGIDHSLFRVSVGDGRIERLTGGGYVSDLATSPTGAALYVLDSLTAPADIWRLDKGGEPVRMTAANAMRLDGLEWPKVSLFDFKGALHDRVEGIAVLPQSSPSTKLPVVLLVHGGPQNIFANRWSYQFNGAALAAQGMGVVAINFHGSTGYGQKFTDAVINDWGGKPLADLKLGLNAALERFDQLDGDRVCAAGGSYGGFMMNWIEGHWPDRFRCLVQAAGPFDMRAMTFETDDLRADEWDFGNRPYFEQPKFFEKWSPVNEVAKWHTPMLVIMGERDYRTPSTQAIAAFTALQQRGIPSRLLAFPDEGHPTLKPRNSLQWYSEVFEWVGRYTARQSTPESRSAAKDHTTGTWRSLRP